MPGVNSNCCCYGLWALLTRTTRTNMLLKLEQLACCHDLFKLGHFVVHHNMLRHEVWLSYNYLNSLQKEEKSIHDERFELRNGVLVEVICDQEVEQPNKHCLRMAQPNNRHLQIS